MEAKTSEKKWAGIRRRTVGWIGGLSTLAVAGLVVAALLFSQTAPPVGAINMSTTCATLVANVAGVVPGTSGHVIFDCGGSPAFSVVGGGTSTPSFSLGTGYTDLYVFQATSPPAGAGCAGGSAFQLTSSTLVSWGASNSYSYCLDYASAPSAGLGAWSISWSN